MVAQTEMVKYTITLKEIKRTIIISSSTCSLPFCHKYTSIFIYKLFSKDPLIQKFESHTYTQHSSYIPILQLFLQYKNEHYRQFSNLQISSEMSDG